MLICGVVILYNPISDEVVTNIRSYLENVEKLVVVNNSDKFDPDLESVIAAEPKIVYIDNKSNLGIARALNIGCAMARQNNFEWVLTMDQDSFFENENLKRLIAAARYFSQDKSISIISPVHEIQTSKKKQLIAGYKEIKFCMTSGNLLNLEVWGNVGGFKEKYFIDYVDQEFCCRVRKRGFKILECKNSILQHRLGEAKKYTFLTKSLTYTNHNYIRRYYIIRNRLDTIKNYFFFDPTFCSKELYGSMAEIVKVLLFEKDKARKVRAYFLGIRDFIIGRFGKFKYMF